MAIEASEGGLLVEDEVPLEYLPTPWPALLKSGKLLTALILSTSYSEKYKGRHIYPGQDNAKVEVRLPTAAGTRSIHPTLLHRAGNKEAVAFIWQGDEGDASIYVAFSPMRYRSQFFKIYCSSIEFNKPEDELLGGSAHTPPWAAGLQTLNEDGTVREDDATAANGNGHRGHTTALPISTYIRGKMTRLWGEQGLWRKLTSTIDRFAGRQVIFAGISHGGTLAQAAALQFRICRPDVDVCVVSWNAYRWTNEAGRSLAASVLGTRLLPFVLSRRQEIFKSDGSSSPRLADPGSPGSWKAVRYWDSITGFPDGFVTMPHPVLLDADTGYLYKHKAPERTSHFSAVTLMRVFELHFARCALTAMRKTMVISLGGDEAAVASEEPLAAPVAERLQETVLNTTQHLVNQGQQVRRQASVELGHVRSRISNAGEEMRSSAAAAAGRFSSFRSQSVRDLTVAVEFIRPRGAPVVAPSATPPRNAGSQSGVCWQFLRHFLCFGAQG